MPENIFCTVCARSGSRLVVDKNIRVIAGKPLLAHTIEQARDAGVFAQIGFSSDSERYLEIAASAGATQLILRPPKLAADEAGKIPAIKHCVAEMERRADFEADIVVDLDCTSPLRLVSDIVECIDLARRSGAGNVVTGSMARRSPYFNLLERYPDGRVDLAKKPDKPILRRQDAPRCYDMNASIYVWRRAALMEREGLFFPDTGLYVMPEERSIDIDSELDFDIVSMLMERRLNDG